MKYLQCFHYLWKTQTLKTPICVLWEELNETEKRITGWMISESNSVYYLFRFRSWIQFENSWNAEVNENALCSAIWWEHAFDAIQESNNRSQKIPVHHKAQSSLQNQDKSVAMRSWPLCTFKRKVLLAFHPQISSDVSARDNVKSSMSNEKFCSF